MKKRVFGVVNFYVWMIVAVFLAVFVMAAAPTINSVVLSSAGENGTYYNLSVAVGASDGDGDNVTLDYNWYKNGVLNSTTLLEDDSLIAYWPFNNNSYDYVGDAAVSSTVGTPQVALGKVGNGYYFDESSYYDYGNDGDLYMGVGNFSVSFWSKTLEDIEELDGLMGNQVVGTSPGWAISYRTGSSYGITMRIANGTAIDIKPTTSQIATINDLAWHHFVFSIVREGGSKLYMDGVEVGSRSDPVFEGQSITQSVNFRIGAWQTYLCNATIDEILIFNRTLTPEEVSLLYLGGSRGYNDLDYSETSVGENWSIGVRAGDNSSSWSTENLTHNITILGGIHPDAPTINSVGLLSTDITSNSSNQNLTASVDYTDPNGANVTPVYNWYKNGVLNSTTLLEDSLIAYWPFNNDSLDYGGSYDLTVNTGSPSLNSSGVVSSVYDFNGVDDVFQFDNITDDFSSGVSVAIWVKSNHLNKDQRFFTHDKRAPYISLQTFVSYTDQFKIQFGNISTTPELGSGDLTDWNHLVVSGNSTILYLYVNGDLKESFDAVNMSKDLGSGNNFIGSSRADTAYFNGSLDEVMMWNRVLSGDEVKQLYDGSRYGGNVMDSSFTSLNDNWTVGIKTMNSDWSSEETNSSNLTVLSATPSVPTLLTPNYNTSTDLNMLLNFSATDEEGDTLTYYVYADENEDPVTLVYSNTDSNYTFTGTANTRYYWKVKAGDGVSNSSNSSVRTFYTQPNIYVGSISPANHRWNKQMSLSYSTDRAFNSTLPGELLLKYFNLRATIYLDDNAGEDFFSNSTKMHHLIDSGSIRFGVYNTKYSELDASYFISASESVRSSILSEYGVEPTVMSYSNNNQLYNASVQQVFLMARNSGIGNYSYSGLSPYYWKSSNSTSRFDDNARTLEQEKAYFDLAFSSGGWFREFDHWHTRTGNINPTPGNSNQNWSFITDFMNYTSHNSSVYYGSSVDVLEYWFIKEYIHSFNESCSGTNLSFTTTMDTYLPSSFRLAQLQTPVTLVITKNESACNFTVDSNLAVEINSIRTPVKIINDTSFWFEVGNGTLNQIKIYNSDSSSLIDLTRPVFSDIVLNDTHLTFDTNQETDYIVYYTNNSSIDVLYDMHSKGNITVGGLGQIDEMKSLNRQFRVLARGDLGENRTKNHVIEIPSVDYEGYDVVDRIQLYVAVTNNMSQSRFLNYNETAPIDYVSASTTPEGTITGSSIEVNVSINDSDTVENLTIYLYNSTGLVQSNSTTNTSLYVNFTGLSDGDYYVNATGSVAGLLNETSTLNINISNPSTATTETTTPSGGAGGVPNYNPSVAQMSDGYTQSLGSGWKVNFEVDDESHSLRVDKIENESVTITVSSDPVTVTLFVNESKKLDLDDDGFYDLFVRLNSLTSLRADVTIQEIDEEIETEVEEAEEEVEEIVGVETIWENRNSQILFVVGLSLLFVAIVIFVVFLGRKKKRLKKR